MICDISMYFDGCFVIIMQLCGLYGEEIIIYVVDCDLYLGSFGGLVVNLIQIFVNVLLMVKDDIGCIILFGFYDGVFEFFNELCVDWEDLGFDVGDFLLCVGLKYFIGEWGCIGLEMVWNQLIFEINGIIGGYIGEGFKIVLFVEVCVKVSFCLIGMQDFDVIWVVFQVYICVVLFVDCCVEFYGYGVSFVSCMDIIDLVFVVVKVVLFQEWGCEVVYIGVGGLILIVGDFKQIFGMDLMLIGFGCDDDCIYLLNEKYDLESFVKGVCSWVWILVVLV